MHRWTTQAMLVIVLLFAAIPAGAQDSGRPVIGPENATQVVEVRRLIHVGGAYDLAWSPDGRWLASSGGDMAVRIWDAQTGELIRALTGHRDIVRYVIWSPDGATLTSASDDRDVRVWDVATGALLEERSESATSYANPGGMRLSPDGRMVALFDAWNSDRVALDLAQSEGGAPLLELAAGTIHDSMNPYYDTVIDLEWSPDGRLLATTAGNLIQWWGIPMPGDPTPAPVVASFPADTPISAGNADRIGLLTYFQALGLSTQIAWSPDSRLLAYTSCPDVMYESYDIHLYDLAAQEDRLVLPGDALAIESVVFSPDGSLIAAALRDGAVRVWDVATGDLTWTPAESDGTAAQVAFSPDGAWLLIGDNNSGIAVWNVATRAWQRQWAVSEEDQTFNLALSPDGRLLATGCYDGAIRLWTLEGDPVATLESQTEDCTSLAFSRDGSLLASGGDGAVQLWNLTTGEAVGMFIGHYSTVYALAFSQDGSVLASSGSEARIILWDVATGIQIATLWGEYASPVPFVSLEFSPDGTKLAGLTDFAGWVWGLPVAAQSATPQSDPTEVLAIGQTAIVHVISPDMLSLRDSPGLGAGIVERLEDGVQVSILDGPRDTDGYVWWRVRAPSGNEGWAVEAADGLQTLVPG